MPTSQIKKFVFDYKTNQTPLSVEKLDELMKFVTESGGGLTGAIIAGVKLILIGVYLTARQKLINEKRLIARQEYEKALSSSHSGANEVIN